MVVVILEKFLGIVFDWMKDVWVWVSGGEEVVKDVVFVVVYVGLSGFLFCDCGGLVCVGMFYIVGE